MVIRVRSGEVDAYAELVRRYTAVAARTAWLLGAGSEVDDVVQESFVRAYQALGRFRADAPFKPWLLRIVANQTRNAHRGWLRGRTRDTTWLDDRPMADDPAELAVVGEANRRLLDAVRNLPEPQRAAVCCRYFLDLDEAATAQVLGVPRGTVKSRLSRALSALRPLLEEYQ